MRFTGAESAIADSCRSSAAIDASVSMWVKIGSQWATMGLYVWTLVAPCLFPDRDFGHY